MSLSAFSIITSRFVTCRFYFPISVMYRNKSYTYRIKGAPVVEDSERNGRMMSKMMGRKSAQELLNPSIGSITAKGVPSFLVRSKGHTQTISRRQAMLNKHFLEGLTDVIATEDIGKLFKEHAIKITQVETGQHYNILNIYWSVPTHKFTQLEEIGQELAQLTGILHKKMIERNFMTLVPKIKFNYDKHKADLEAIESASAFRPAHDNGYRVEDKEPQKVAPQPEPEHVGYTRIDPMRNRMKWARKVSLFVDKQMNQKPKESLYTVPSFECPEDMRLDARGLDYRKIMNRVLANMKRVKSAEYSHPLNPVADPLPPSTWVSPPVFPPDHLMPKPDVQDTDTRLKNMKSFVINYKKKQNRQYREVRKEVDMNLFGIHEHLTQVKDGLDVEYSFDDKFEPDHDLDDGNDK